MSGPPSLIPFGDVGNRETIVQDAGPVECQGAAGFRSCQEHRQDWNPAPHPSPPGMDCQGFGAFFGGGGTRKIRSPP
jgi:hypothetical protein